MTSTDSNRFVAGISVEDAGYPLLLLFLAWLCQHLWHAGGSPWLLGLGLAAATVWVGVGLAINGVWTAALEAGASTRSLWWVFATSPRTASKPSI